MDEQFSSYGQLKQPKKGIHANFGLKNRKIEKTSTCIHVSIKKMNITIGFVMKTYSGIL
jgi:hypothetical protein